MHKYKDKNIFTQIEAPCATSTRMKAPVSQKGNASADRDEAECTMMKKRVQ